MAGTAWSLERLCPTAPGAAPRPAKLHPQPDQPSPAQRAPGPAGHWDLVSRACAHPGSQGLRMPAAAGLGTARWVGAGLLVSRKCCGRLGLVRFAVCTSPGTPEREQGLSHFASHFWGSRTSRSSPRSPLGVSNARAGPCLRSMALLPSPEQGARQGLRGTDCVQKTCQGPRASEGGARISQWDPSRAPEWGWEGDWGAMGSRSSPLLRASAQQCQASGGHQ